MKCPSCGSNDEQGSFCRYCGCALTPPVVPAPPAQPVYQGSSAPPAYAPPAPSASPSAPYQAASVAPSEGCVAAAWHDIKATKGWFGKLILLGLINIVPILNFVVTGYAVQWGREVPFGQRNSLPKEIFANRTFSVGFFALLTAVVFGLVYGLASGILSAITFGIFGLVAVVAGVFFLMFLYAAIMRMGVVGRLGAAFNLSKVWAAYKRSLGALFCASFVPGLIASLIIGAVALVAMMLVALLGLGSYSVYSGGYAARAMGVPLMGGMLAIIVVVGLLMLVVNAFVEVLTFRALGYWAARTAPEWVYEAQVPGQGATTAYPSGVAGPGAYPPPAASAPQAYVPPVVPQEPTMPSGMPRKPEPHPAAPAAPARDDGTTRLDEPAPGSSGATPRLALVKPSGERFEVDVFPAIVGKGSAANVRIDGNSAISRAHVRISWTGSSFVLEDLGATNGTYLNGNPLAEGELVLLSDGDDLRLGDEALKVAIK